MKICQEHWDRLRAAIDERGMGHLVGRSGEEAINRLMQEMKGEATPFTYDPLLSCNNMIFANALEHGGLYLMGTDEEGNEYCPVCEAVKHATDHDEAEKEWIHGPADGALKCCKDQGILPTPGVHEATP